MVSINLLQALEELTLDNITIETIESIKLCLTDRLNWLEFREPECDGETYSNWEDKCERIQDAIDQSDDIIDELKGDRLNKEYIEECIENLRDIVFDYQFWYKGLSRLKISLKNENNI